MMRLIFLIGMAMMAVLSCGRSKTGGFSTGELEILNCPDSIMRVLTVEDSVDLAVLRAESRDFSLDELASDEFKRLGLRMISTVLPIWQEEWLPSLV